MPELRGDREGAMWFIYVVNSLIFLIMFLNFFSLRLLVSDMIH